MINKSMVRARLKLLTPNLEAATLYSRGPGQDATFTAYSLPFARFTGGTLSESQAPGVTLSTLPTGSWRITQQALDADSSPDPKVGDIIGRTSDSTYWLVLNIQNSLFEQFWAVDVQQQMEAPATS